MIKQNLHTHSIYCDGNDTIEEMVLAAIDKGFTTLGFSGHGNCRNVDNYSMDEINTQKYLEDVLRVKEKYQDQIKIFLGIEQDVLGKHFIKGKPYDYIIGSVHFVKAGDRYLAVDESKDVTQEIVTYFGSFLNYAKSYFEEVEKIVLDDEVDIVGHIDLLTKFNEDEEFIKFDELEYLKLAYQCIDKLLEKKKIFEVNTGAIARGQRKTPYPHHLLLKYIYDHGGKICLNSDCHNKEMLDCYYNEALALIQTCGFQTMMELTNDGFVERKIEEFLK
ncbi:MAG: histidinol-phosphatase [Thomasclavelia sp.]